VDRRRHRAFFIAFLFVLEIALPRSAFAWGKLGHAVVADIAQAQLEPDARKHAEELLQIEGLSRLADIASWADGPQKKVPGAPRHTIQLGFADEFDRSKCEQYFCIVAGIEHYKTVLANQKLPKEDRLKALKYVVHLVGDIHQPLHCVLRKYSRTPVWFRGKAMTLHGVWDKGVIQQISRDQDALTKHLLQTVRTQSVSGDAASWALESRNLARDYIFANLVAGSPERVTLPDDYSATNWPIVSLRLRQAGDRLSFLLNEALR
jgi:hypothetical protein